MYIGIIGCTGDIKVKIAQLIGETLAWMLDNQGNENEFDYLKSYWEWCENLSENKDADPDSRVYYASFSHPLKMIVSMITGVPFDVLNDPTKKHSYVIDINTFEYHEKKDDEKMISPEKLFRKRGRVASTEYSKTEELPEGFMTLNDYIIYFGYYICRNYIGKDVWTLVEKNSKYKTRKEDIRIYTDVRSISEYEYIKENEGIIIRINDINGGSISISVVYDNEIYNIPVDIEFTITKDIRLLNEDIYNTCKNILNNQYLH